MALKGVRDTEKVAVGAIRTAIQTWLAPQLSGISEPLARVEERLVGVDQKLAGMDERINSFRNEMAGMGERLGSFRNEMHAELATLHREIKRLDLVAELRERLAAVETKLAAHQS